MKYQVQHENFRRLAIAHGIGNIRDLWAALPFGCDAPGPVIDRWIGRLGSSATEFSSQRRYVNRFKLGADPEFVFVSQGGRYDARTFNLQQGQAFGMDNNGRLTEIRPYPSRSALEVVASIGVTLRWLALLRPKTLEFDWTAGAFLFGDGLGGHVHFGRKRPGRDLEIKALDAIEEELLGIRVYPVNEVLRRRQGDEHRQLYGLPGDFRKQRHGYEYRTFPSWLDSPELAFLTITLSKLAVQKPELTQGFVPLEPMRRLQRLHNLLAYYKDVDDDARIALCMIARGWPFHRGGDFKARWGVDPLLTSKVEKVSFLPSSIQPDAEDIAELFAHLTKSAPMERRALTPNWSPVAPPEGYVMAIDQTTTHQAKGLGELLWDVVQHSAFKYIVKGSREGWPPNVMLAIPAKLAGTLPAGWKRFTGNKIVAHNYDDKSIYSLDRMREPATFNQVRQLLVETVLPFWPISKVKSDSWQQWHKGTKTKPDGPKFSGQLVSGDLIHLPIKELR